MSVESFIQRFKLPIYAGGIFILYFYYGILQESIIRRKFAQGKNTYTMKKILLFFYCYPLFYKLLRFVLQQGEDSTRRSYYASCSLTYLLAMVSSNMALQWVSYPTQVVGKSCKPIPVMVLGVLLGRKSYTWRKYFFIFMIVIGVALFIYKDKKTTTAQDHTGLGLGEMMLLLSLTMDGLTGAVQERMIAESKTKSGHMMLNMNVFSIGYLAVALLVTGELFTFISFVQRFPEVITKMIVFSICSALGQFFIFLMVSDFGPLPCSITTTTRKFFTVLGSVIFFGNVLVPRQWLGTVFVFTEVILNILWSKSVKTLISNLFFFKKELHSRSII
ncbi:unnamed protein product, partial [Meganyctiphanes norvegica]